MPRPEQICGTSQGDTRGARGRSASKMAGSGAHQGQVRRAFPSPAAVSTLTRVEAG
jgi:hypothetical protein